MKKILSFLSLTLALLLLCSCASNIQPLPDENFQAEIVSMEKDDNPCPDEPEYTFVCSGKSNVYHMQNCRYTNKIKPCNLVYFYSCSDAEEGYRPCHICLQ